MSGPRCPPCLYAYEMPSVGRRSTCRAQLGNRPHVHTHARCWYDVYHVGLGCCGTWSSKDKKGGPRCRLCVCAGGEGLGGGGAV